MIFLWDTDTFSWWQRHHDAFRDRLATLSDGDSVAVSSVTVYEALRGRLAVVSQARNERGYVSALAGLTNTFAALSAWQVLPCTADAVAQFGQLRSRRGNVGSADVRIAAIALCAGAVLVTRNVAHFNTIPALIVENWID